MMSFYIDPGTGSMLFSILIGVLGAGYYFFRNLFIKLKYSASSSKAERLIETCQDFVVFSESRRYWNIFKPICDEFEKREIDLVYYTTSEDDPVFSHNYSHIKGEFLGEGNKAFTKLNYLNASVVLSTTPSLDVYQWKRSKNVKHYAHIAHMPNDITTYEMFGLDHYDSILLSGSYQIDQIRALERIRNLPKKECVLVGLPYMDEMKQRLDNTPAENNDCIRNILLAPSWGKSGILSLFGEKVIDPLIETGYNIVVRPHPQSFISEADLINRLMDKYPEKEKFHWNRDNDNFNVLKDADVLISDFSGVIFDYTLVFDKPVIYTDVSAFNKAPYDAAWLDDDLWTFRVLPSLGEQITMDNIGSIKEIIDRVCTEPKYKQARDRARSETWCYPGEGAVRVVDYLAKKYSELSS